MDLSYFTNSNGKSSGGYDYISKLVKSGTQGTAANVQTTATGNKHGFLFDQIVQLRADQAKRAEKIANLKNPPTAEQRTADALEKVGTQLSDLLKVFHEMLIKQNESITSMNSLKGNLTNSNDLEKQIAQNTQIMTTSINSLIDMQKNVSTNNYTA